MRWCGLLFALSLAACAERTGFPLGGDPRRDREAAWQEILALEGAHWVYLARDAYVDLAKTTRVGAGDSIAVFTASGNDTPTVSDLQWVGGYDYTQEQLWYAAYGPTPTFVDRGDFDSYVRFENGLASNFESQPGQLSPAEGRGEPIHFVFLLRPMPGSAYEGGFGFKDRSGDGSQLQILYGGDPDVLGPSGVTTRIGEDNIVEIAYGADGSVALSLNETVVLNGSFPSLPGTGFVEFVLGTNSHVMSAHFRAVLIKRGALFSAAELETIRANTNVIWPRGQKPIFPYLDGQFRNRSTEFDFATKTWAPPIGTFSGGNGRPGTHVFQWYYWDRTDDTAFPLGNPLEEHVPFPGADGQGPTLSRAHYEAGNGRGNPVIFTNPGNADVSIMRTVVPIDDAGTPGERLAGEWAPDNIP